MQNASVADLIKMIIEKVNYEDYLRTSQPDWDSRWENVKELVSPFSSFFLFLHHRVSPVW